jgi:D-alanyl-D-alanine carboxypeptidase
MHQTGAKSGRAVGIFGALALAAGLAIATALPFAPPASAAPTSSMIVVDANSGRVLLQSNADVLTYPASLTKMMTLYLLFDALHKGQLTMAQPLPVSVYAATMPATNLALQAGDSIPVSIAIQAMIIRSANDVAVVVAEALGGSEQAFAMKMNAKARALGMTQTYYRNPNGLPDPEQHTTARDMAILALALHRDFPQYYAFFTQPRFSYNGRTYITHNRFLLHYPGADGLKTGYIRLSGFNLAASATRNGRRLVAVVMGGQSPSQRDASMWALLDQGFGTATPKNQNNALLLASAGTTDLMPLLKPEGDNDVYDQPNDTTDDADGDSDVAAMTPQIAGLPRAPAAPLTATLLQPRAPQDQPAKAAATGQTPQPVGTAGVAATTLSAQIPLVPLQPSPSTNSTSMAAIPVPMLRPFSVDAPGVSDGVVSIAVDAKRFWGVQVGAFSRYNQAHLAAEKAQAKLPFEIHDTRIAVDETDGRGGKLFRARLVGLAQNEANDACRELRARQTPCLVVQANVAMAMTQSQ